MQIFLYILAVICGWLMFARDIRQMQTGLAIIAALLVILAYTTPQ